MTKKKKRKLRKGRLLLLIVAFIILIALVVLLVKGIVSLFTKEEYVFDKDTLKLETLNCDDMSELDLDLYSNSYIVIRLNDMKVLYGKDIYEKFYPASLTKVLTLDTLCHNFSDFSDTSYFTKQDYDELIVANASLANLKIDTNYSLDDLLYALVLKSGADSARALENYYEAKGLDLVDEMNNVCLELGLTNSNFTNTTGLHDDDLYTTLADYSLIVIDTLKYNEGKSVLKTFEKTLSDGTVISSTVSSLSDIGSQISVYGGKTGFTGEAGENIMVLFETGNDSYLIVLAGALGNPYNTNQQYHLKDARNIINFLYN